MTSGQYSDRELDEADELLEEDEPEESSDDEQKELDGRDCYVAHLSTLCEHWAKQHADSLEFRRGNWRYR